MTTAWPPVVADGIGPLAGRVRVYLAIPTQADVWDTARWDQGRWDAGGAEILDVTCQCDGLEVIYGRDDTTGHQSPMAATFALDNSSGEFTPWFNTAYRRRRWWIGAPVRIATPDGPLFTGAIAEMVEPDAAGTDPLVAFTCYGSAAYMARANGREQPDQGSNERAAARLNRICDAANLPAFVPRDFDPGVVNLQPTTLASGALEEAWLTADSDGGAFYELTDGTLRYADAATLDNGLRHTEPQAVFTDGTTPDNVAPGTPVICMAALTTKLAADGVVNVVSIAAAGGTAHVASRPADSWAGDRTYSRHDLIYATESHGDYLADTVLERLAGRELQVEPLLIDPLDDEAAWQIAHDLAPYDLIRVVRVRDAQRLDAVATVDQIRHAITLNSWTTTITTSPAVQRFDWPRWDVDRWDAAAWA